VSSDVFEIEDDILSSSNSATPDLPKIEGMLGMYSTYIIYLDLKIVN